MQQSKATIPFFGVEREFYHYKEEITDRVVSVLESGQVLQGQAISSLEKRVAGLSGRKFGIAVNSCTDALYFGLVAAGVKPGDEVLVTDFSFIASASCIARLGAIPVFVDIDPVTFNMDLKMAASLVNENTKGIIFVHLYGQMSDPAEIEEFAAVNDLILIEDAAQSIGASYDERPAGSIGLASCFSFDPTKPISAPGSGGIVVTDEPEMAERLKRLRYHGKTAENQFKENGYNSQMSTLVAAVLDFKLNHIGQWQAKRRAVAKYYNDRLASTGAVLPQELPGVHHIYHKYVLQTGNRDEIKKYLNAQGVDAKIHYACPLHREFCFATLNSPDDRLYPHAIRCSQNVLSLPVHPFLTDAEVETVTHALVQALDRS